MTVNALECAFRTHVGKVRTNNEDYLIAIPDRGVLALGDGMGGHHAGEVASRLAVEAAARQLLEAQAIDVADALESLMCVEQAGEAANSAVMQAVRENPELYGMGTTLVMLLSREERVFYAHVGDSRLYRWREGEFKCLTRDHSLLQEMLDSGMFRSVAEAARAGVGDNVLTRSIGLERYVEIDVAAHELLAGDTYLLCSDGLCGKVSDLALATMISPESTLEEMADKMLQAALDSGGRDNISLIVARPVTA